jgi:serine/threonine protein kinase
LKPIGQLRASSQLPVSHQIPVEADPPRVGPYLVDRRLGAGGMGTVYLAHHEQTGQQAAIKVLAPSLAREEGLVARFMREIDALKKLKNPHVVELFDHGVDGDMHYYAMEYVEGETLTARLRREKRLPWREAVELSIQICIALKAAHDAGIIHRDLKPSNLLLTPEGQIKLTDFGVAQVFAGSKLTVTGGIIGTAEYMSPEQGQGRRITKRSDLYSLGAVMYVMLTGRPPFSGKTTLDVIHKHTYSQFDRPRLRVPDIPFWLDEIVCQLMEKDPEKRFADAFVVNRKLQELLRKVELSSNDLTLDSASTGADQSTIDASTGPRSAALRGMSAGPGSGTLMRDLFRAEIEAESARSPLRALLDNTWILVGAFVLVVAGVVYWTLNSSMTPEQRFDKGVDLLEENEPANWRIVRDEYFAPLTALNSTEWDERLKPYLTRIRIEELKASLNKKSVRHRVGKRGPDSEIERLLAWSRHQQENGDFTGAERTLTSLLALLAGSAEFEPEQKLVEQTLNELRSRAAGQPADLSFVDAALDRADGLAKEGKRDEAVGIWQGIVDLYKNDPAAASLVERARRELAIGPQKAVPVKTTSEKSANGQTAPKKVSP